MKLRFLECFKEFAPWHNFFKYFSIKPILVFPLTGLILQGATLSMTAINFWKTSEYAGLTSSKYS